MNYVKRQNIFKKLKKLKFNSRIEKNERQRSQNMVERIVN